VRRMNSHVFAVTSGKMEVPYSESEIECRCYSGAGVVRIPEWLNTCVPGDAARHLPTNTKTKRSRCVIAKSKLPRLEKNSRKHQS
jgi:hypothetical protein